MNTRTKSAWNEDRPSGVPAPGHLGASGNEMLALMAAALIFVLILAAFWFQASR